MVKVEIVVSGRSEACMQDCGTDWSLPEARMEAGRAVKQAFGAEVRLSYQSLTRNKVARVKYGNERVFPLLMINGHVRLTGEFEVRQIIDLVQAERELST